MNICISWSLCSICLSRIRTTLIPTFCWTVRWLKYHSNVPFTGQWIEFYSSRVQISMPDVRAHSLNHPLVLLKLNALFSWAYNKKKTITTGTLLYAIDIESNTINRNTTPNAMQQSKRWWWRWCWWWRRLRLPLLLLGTADGMSIPYIPIAYCKHQQIWKKRHYK